MICFLKIEAHQLHDTMSAPATSEASKEDLKTQFITREGLYKVVALSDCMRQNRNSFNGQCNTPVKISFINFGDKSGGCGGVGKENGRNDVLQSWKGTVFLPTQRSPESKLLDPSRFCQSVNIILVF